MVERGYVTEGTFHEIARCYPQIRQACTQAWACSPEAVLAQLHARQVSPDALLSLLATVIDANPDPSAEAP